MLRFKVPLGRYAGYFDYYVENGVMPESYSLDPLADYLQEVLNEPSNKYLCMIDTNWRESIKRSLLDFFEQMLKLYVPIDSEYNKEMINDRFAAYIKRYSTDTQFILITHRRGTMEAANRLYGVTMPERGISKVLELNIDDISKKKGDDWDGILG